MMLEDGVFDHVRVTVRIDVTTLPFSIKTLLWVLCRCIYSNISGTFFLVKYSWVQSLHKCARRL